MPDATTPTGSDDQAKLSASQIDATSAKTTNPGKGSNPSADATVIAGIAADGTPERDPKTPVSPPPSVEINVASSDPASHAGQLPNASVVVKTVEPGLEKLQTDYENYLRFLVQNPVTGADLQWEAQLAAYIKLDNPLATIGRAQLYRIALLGVGALETRRMGVATQISSELDFATSTSAALSQVMLGLFWFLSGFAALALVVGYSTLFLLSALPAPTGSGAAVSGALNITPFSAATLAKVLPIGIATIFGCLGSVVSLLLRLPEFEALKGRSRAFLRLTGATLPVIGGIFGAVTAALFVSKIINLSIIQESAESNNYNIFLFIVIGFISGFSERFTRNLLSTAETTLVGGRAADSGTVRVTVPDRTGVVIDSSRAPGTDPAPKPSVTRPDPETPT